MPFFSRYLQSRDIMNQQHKYQLRKGPRPCNASEAGPFKPLSINDSDEYEVEAIVGRRIINGLVHYNVKWKGWPSEENTWEPFLHCMTCIDSVLDFEEELKEDSIAGPSWHPKGNYGIPSQRILSSGVLKGLEYVRKCQDADSLSCTDNSNVKKTTRNKIICQKCANVIPPSVSVTRRSLDVNPPQLIVIPPTVGNNSRSLDVNPPQLETTPVELSLACFDETTQFVDMCEVGKTTANGRSQVREFTSSMQAMRTASDLRSECPSVSSGNSNIAYMKTSICDFANLEKVLDSTAIRSPFTENSRVISSARTIVSTASGEKSKKGGRNSSGHRAEGMVLVGTKKKQKRCCVKRGNWRRNKRREKALKKNRRMCCEYICTKNSLLDMSYM